ncbi:MAG TPA: indole-3-glycerol-phosphate synthase [Thermoanaerobaculaceae bacterium]|nr:indole-3-glycerol-phosphate synthase [Thermoanaerobaculaceae bacterium]HRS16134.1 indole-3-glycerol-phosphate synthase [Thermoanaerobaculaceae bacterium]
MSALERLLAGAARRVAELRETVAAGRAPALAARLTAPAVAPAGSFERALRRPGLSVVAEVKRRSPSAGAIAAIPDPAALARAYAAGGAAAVSVLTEPKQFGGSLADLEVVARAVSLPVLRKDFLLDPLQLAEAAEAGASAVLLVVAALGARTGDMLAGCERLGLEALVEVHDEGELEVALGAGARVVGVNSRNLRTFEVDLGVAERLRPRIPAGVVAVAESGVRTPDEARRMREAGYDAVLVGGALAADPDPAGLVARLGAA